MSAALAAIAGVLGLLVLLLAVPVEVAFRLRGLDDFGGQVSIRWMFGLVRFRMPVPAQGRTRRQARERPPRAATGKRPRHRAGGRRLAGLLRQPEFRRRALRLAGDLARAARLEGLALRLRLGLGDPAETGRLWALLGPLEATARNLRNAQVSLEPEFLEAVLEFDAQGRCRLVPLRWLALVVAFALSPASIRAWTTPGNGNA